MNKYVLETGALVPIPAYAEAETAEEAFRKAYGDYVFKEVSEFDMWDIKVMRLTNESLISGIPSYDEIKYFEVRFG